MNAFVCSVTCILYSEVSSIDYLVASIEHVRLPCDIVFTKVSSKDYLVARDRHVRLYVHIIEMKRVVFDSCFRNPPKRTEIRVKKFLKETSFQVRD